MSRRNAPTKDRAVVVRRAIEDAERAGARWTPGSLSRVLGIKDVLVRRAVAYLVESGTLVPGLRTYRERSLVLSPLHAPAIRED